MSHNKLYFISQDVYTQEFTEQFLNNITIYANLKDALDELNKIYNNTPDFKWYGFCVRTLIKIKDKYIQGHETYYHQKGYS
jgi:hypothetical protein